MFSKPKLSEAFSVPNILTYFRILLVPVFIYFFLNAETTSDYRMAALIVALSTLTDFLDGQIARRCNMITGLGMIIDPIADKLTQAAVILCLSSRYKLMWLLIALLVIKESYLAVMGYIMMKQNKSLNGAKWYGKVSTGVIFAVMLIFLIFPDIPMLWANVFIALCAVWMLISLVLYIREYAIMAKTELPNEPNEK